VRSVEGSDEVRGMGEFGSGKPLVIGRRIAKPVDKIVERGVNETGVKHRFNFVVFISVDKVQRRSSEVRAMGSGFVIRR